MEITYWIILGVWIVAIWVLRKKASLSMKIALYLFIAAAALTVFGFRNPAELVMRVSFIGWLVGISQAIREYVRESK